MFVWYLLLLFSFNIRSILSFNIKLNRYQLSSVSLSSDPSISIPTLPTAVIIATNNNLKDEQLEIIDDILFSTVNQKMQPPVFIVGNQKNIYIITFYHKLIA
jgi:hypothetical protein